MRSRLSTDAGLCTAHVTEQRLNAGDEHLVVATQGFWDVVSADDAALLLHFHLKVACQHSDILHFVRVSLAVNHTLHILQNMIWDHACCG